MDWDIELTSTGEPDTGLSVIVSITKSLSGGNQSVLEPDVIAKTKRRVPDTTTAVSMEPKLMGDPGTCWSVLPSNTERLPPVKLAANMRVPS